MNFENPSYEWTTRGKSFSVQIKAWTRDSDDWNWNVYAFIYEGHPLFQKPAQTKQLHFHGGCTYDELVSTEPVEGIEYDWQLKIQYIKVGSDYKHYMDHYENEHPKHGIPFSIKRDAEILFKELEECQGG